MKRRLASEDSRLGGLVQFGFFLVGGAVSVLVGPAADEFDRINVLCGVVLCGCVPSLLMSLMVPSSKASYLRIIELDTLTVSHR